MFSALFSSCSFLFTSSLSSFNALFSDENAHMHKWFKTYIHGFGTNIPQGSDYCIYVFLTKVVKIKNKNNIFWD